jgi:hypothetical protein
METWKEEVETRRSLPSEEKEGGRSTRLAPPRSFAIATTARRNRSSRIGEEDQKPRVLLIPLIRLQILITNCVQITLISDIGSR